MPRVKRGKTALQKRKMILKYTRGFRWDRKSKKRAAKEALLHAWTHAFEGRKNRKRDFRSLWQVKINAALRQAPAEGEPFTYSKFIHKLKIKNIKLNRKSLADLAQNNPDVFKRVISQTQ